MEIRRERERGSKGEEEWRRDGMSSEIELCVGGSGRGGAWIWCELGVGELEWGSS